MPAAVEILIGVICVAIVVGTIAAIAYAFNEQSNRKEKEQREASERAQKARNDESIAALDAAPYWHKKLIQARLSLLEAEQHLQRVGAERQNSEMPTRTREGGKS